MGRVEKIRKGTSLRKRIIDTLECKYKLSERGTVSVSTFLKRKIKAASTKIRWYIEKCVKTKQNNLFRNNQSQLYKELTGITKGDTNQVPKAAESREFSSNIWSQPQEHNRKAACLDSVKERMQRVKRQKKVDVQLEDIEAGIRRMANWKALGPDGFRGFRFKKFLSLPTTLTTALQNCLYSREVPAWMVKGRTMLV